MRVQPGVKKLNTDPSSKNPILEAILLKWIKERRNNQQAVSRIMVQMKVELFAQ